MVANTAFLDDIKPPAEHTKHQDCERNHGEQWVWNTALNINQRNASERNFDRECFRAFQPARQRNKQEQCCD